MAVVCRDGGGNIRSARLLDVYEAEHDPTRTVLRATNDFEEDYARLVKNTYRLQGSNYFDSESTARNLRQFMGLVKWVELPEELPFLNDHGRTPVMLIGCNLEQLAVFYDENGRVLIQSEIWRHLDTLNRAALVQHELFYRFERMFRETTSESSRSYVRQIVSVQGNTPVQAGIESAKLRCSAVTTGRSDQRQVTVFYVHQAANDMESEDVKFQFTQIAGRPLLVKGTVSIPDLIFETRRVIDRTLGPVLIAEHLGRRVETFPVITQHRSDWEIRLKYVTGQPIMLTLLQGGQPLSESVLTGCSAVQ